MLMKKYLIRFDDVNERMDWDKFLVLKTFRKIQYQINFESCPKL